MFGNNFQQLMKRVPMGGTPQPQATPQAPTQGINRPLMQNRPAPSRPSQPQRVSPGVYRQADGSLSRGNQMSAPRQPQMPMPNDMLKFQQGMPQGQGFGQMAQALSGNFGQPQFQSYAPMGGGRPIRKPLAMESGIASGVGQAMGQYFQR